MNRSAIFGQTQVGDMGIDGRIFPVSALVCCLAARKG